MAIVIQIIIALIIAGFVFWAIRALINIIPLDPFFKSIIDILITIAVVAVIIFFVVIPLLHMLAGANLGGLGLR